MIIPVYRIRSTLTQLTDDAACAYIAAVSRASGHTLRFVNAEEFANAPFALLYVASGGSEQFFLDEFNNLTRILPCRILTSGESNSLAASMEILSCLREKGMSGEILHGSLSDIGAKIDALACACGAREKLRGKKFGCVGDPSDWLIASPADDAGYREKLGVSVERIPITELTDEAKKGFWPDNEYTRALEKNDWDKGEIKKALAVYGALYRIAEKYGLAGVSVRCFDLLEPLGTTGCLALAILNAQGINAGCEGDVPSLISMAVLGAVSGQGVFMCNPSRIDTEKNEMILAHCTLPIDMPLSYTLMTHYESGIGVALRGKLPEGSCTIFKLSEKMDRFHAQTARLLENLEDPSLCRTQIRLKVKDTRYFLTDPIHNHHLVAMGDHTRALEAFFDLVK